MDLPTVEQLDATLDLLTERYYDAIGEVAAQREVMESIFRVHALRLAVDALTDFDHEQFAFATE